VHAPFWQVRRGPRALRTVARGCASRAGFPTTRRGAAWGTLGGWTRPRTSDIVKQRTYLNTPTSQVMGPVSLVVIVVFRAVVGWETLVGLPCVPASGG